MTSTIQSISFPADKYTAKRAMKWLKEHKLKPVKRVDKTDNMLRYRIVDPKEFGRFATKKTTEGITLTFGFKSDPEEKGGRQNQDRVESLGTRPDDGPPFRFAACHED